MHDNDLIVSMNVRMWSIFIVFPCENIKYEMFLFLIGFTDVTKKLEGALAEDVRVKESIHQQIHRMCLLRVKLMHFVNSLHNYIMTRVRQTVEQISKFPKMQILHLERIYI